MGSVGISDIGIYIPKNRISIDQVIDSKTSLDDAQLQHRKRAAATTGQKAIRFPDKWEDSATLGAEAARDLFSQ
ncbi:MAG: hypothetical protein ACLFR1_15585 [Spirochaetia bacterium]